MMKLFIAFLLSPWVGLEVVDSEIYVRPEGPYLASEMAYVARILAVIN
jgi:hypothetical protein